MQRGDGALSRADAVLLQFLDAPSALVVPVLAAILALALLGWSAFGLR